MILVTGHHGFIGCEVGNQLTARGIEWEGVDLNPHCEMFEHDVDPNNYTGIIHLAAHKSVAESIENPLKYYNNNVIALNRFLLKLKKDIPFVFVSSAAAKYPTNPYGISKVLGEAVCKQHIKPELLAIVRPENVIGVGTEDGVIPLMAKAKKSGRVMDIHRGCTRDFITVEDTAQGIIDAKLGTTMSLGTSEYHTISCIADYYQVPYKLVVPPEGFLINSKSHEERVPGRVRNTNDMLDKLLSDNRRK